MLNPNHPDDERLSGLASRDDEATTDAELTAHVADCDRCTDLVSELGALRSSLAALPDLVPSRPLRLLPEVDPEASSHDRVGGWVRRLFAPAMTAGAALAMVGLIGTATPALDNLAPNAGQPADQAANGDAALDGAAEETAPARVQSEAYTGEEADGAVTNEGTPGVDDRQAPTGLPAERSPWPMVLFTGIALIAATALLRWILEPRAG